MKYLFRAIMGFESEYFQETTLPLKFRNLVWSLIGTHLALIASDNSLWKIDYPKLENLEQLTPSLPYYADYVSWSPNHTYLSLMSGPDIYIVDTVK